MIKITRPPDITKQALDYIDKLEKEANKITFLGLKDLFVKTTGEIKMIQHDHCHAWEVELSHLREKLNEANEEISKLKRQLAEQKMDEIVVDTIKTVQQFINTIGLFPTKSIESIKVSEHFFSQLVHHHHMEMNRLNYPPQYPHYLVQPKICSIYGVKVYHE